MDPAKVIYVNTSREVPTGVGLVAVFEELAAITAGEPHLLTQTPEALAVQFEKGLSCLGFSAEGLLVAHTTIWWLCDHKGAEWYELGTTWVRKEWREHKINHAMYRNFLPGHIERNILATTTNLVSYQVGWDLGFVDVPRRVLPKKVWQRSCSCSIKKMGSPVAETCLLAAREPQNQLQDVTCWFRVTPETAGRLALAA